MSLSKTATLAALKPSSDVRQTTFPNPHPYPLDPFPTGLPAGLIPTLRALRYQIRVLGWELRTVGLFVSHVAWQLATLLILHFPIYATYDTVWGPVQGLADSFLPHSSSMLFPWSLSHDLLGVALVVVLPSLLSRARPETWRAANLNGTTADWAGLAATAQIWLALPLTMHGLSLATTGDYVPARSFVGVLLLWDALLFVVWSLSPVYYWLIDGQDERIEGMGKDDGSEEEKRYGKGPKPRSPEPSGSPSGLNIWLDGVQDTAERQERVSALPLIHPDKGQEHSADRGRGQSKEMKERGMNTGVLKQFAASRNRGHDTSQKSALSKDRSQQRTNTPQQARATNATAFIVSEERRSSTSSHATRTSSKISSDKLPPTPPFNPKASVANGSTQVYQAPRVEDASSSPDTETSPPDWSHQYQAIPGVNPRPILLSEQGPHWTRTVFETPTQNAAWESVPSSSSSKSPWKSRTVFTPRMSGAVQIPYVQEQVASAPKQRPAAAEALPATPQIHASASTAKDPTTTPIPRAPRAPPEEPAPSILPTSAAAYGTGMQQPLLTDLVFDRATNSWRQIFRGSINSMMGTGDGLSHNLAGSLHPLSASGRAVPMGLASWHWANEAYLAELQDRYHTAWPSYDETSNGGSCEPLQTFPVPENGAAPYERHRQAWARAKPLQRHAIGGASGSSGGQHRERQRWEVGAEEREGWDPAADAIAKEWELPLRRELDDECMDVEVEVANRDESGPVKACKRFS